MDTLKKYDAAPIVAKVLELVKEFPMAKYDNGACLYTEGKATNGKCGCLVGQAIVLTYPDLEKELKEIDSNGPCPLYYVLPNLGVHCTEEQSSLLRVIQRRQDSGEVWGNCITPNMIQRYSLLE